MRKNNLFKKAVSLSMAAMVGITGIPVSALAEEVQPVFQEVEVQEITETEMPEEQAEEVMPEEAEAVEETEEVTEEGGAEESVPEEETEIPVEKEAAAEKQQEEKEVQKPQKEAHKKLVWDGGNVVIESSRASGEAFPAGAEIEAVTGNGEIQLYEDLFADEGEKVEAVCTISLGFFDENNNRLPAEATGYTVTFHDGGELAKAIANGEATAYMYDNDGKILAPAAGGSLTFQFTTAQESFFAMVLSDKEDEPAEAEEPVEAVSETVDVEAAPEEAKEELTEEEIAAPAEDVQEDVNEDAISEDETLEAGYEIIEESADWDDEEDEYFEDNFQEADEKEYSAEIPEEDYDEAEKEEVPEQILEEEPAVEEELVEAEEPEAPAEEEEGEIRWDPEDFELPGINDYIDDSQFPANGSEDFVDMQRIWILDTGFDYRSYAPDYRFASNVSIRYDHGVIDYSKEGMNNVYYLAEMIGREDRNWYVVVPFEVVAEKSLRTVGTEEAESLIPVEQGAEYSGLVAKHIGEIIDGGVYAVGKGRDFNLWFTNLGYDPDVYNVSVKDDGGFASDVEGNYTVTFTVRSIIHPEYWFDVKAVFIVTNDPVEAGNTIIWINDYTIEGTVLFADGSSAAVKYGTPVVSNKKVAAIEAKGYMVENIEPSVEIFEGNAILEDAVVSEIRNRNYYKAEINADAFNNEFGHEIVIGNKLDPEKAGLMKSTGGEGMDEDFLSEETIKTYAVGASQTFSNGAVFGQFTSPTFNGGIYQRSAWNGASFNLTSATQQGITNFLSQNGLESMNAIPTSIDTHCISGHAYYGWMSTANFGSATVQTTLLDTNGDGKEDTLYIVLTAQPSNATFQTFQGSISVSLTESEGECWIQKTSDSPVFVTNFATINVDTQFGVYRDKACKDLAATVSIKSVGANATGKVKLPAGKYYLKEIGRMPGHFLQKDKVFGPYEVKGNQVTKTEPIKNYAYYFNDILLQKVDDKGKPLANAYFLIHISVGGNLRAWIMKTDSNGYIKYDNAHLVKEAIVPDAKANLTPIDKEKVLKSNGTVQGLQNLLTKDGSVVALPECNVYMVEVKAPAGYEVDQNRLMVEIRGNEKSIRTVLTNIPKFVDTPKKAKLALKKINATTQDSTVPNTKYYSVEGAEFKVYADENLKNVVATLTTDSTGKTKTIELPLGTYYVKETKAPKNFKLNTTVYKYTLSRSGDQETYSYSIPDSYKRGWIKLHKFVKSVDGKVIDPIEVDYSKIKFVLIGEDKKEIKVNLDKDGNAEIKNLDFGSYTLRETATLEGYPLLPDRTLTVNTDTPLEITMTNRQGGGIIYLRKLNADSNSAELPNDKYYSLKDAEYTIYKDKDCKDSTGIILKTDENGNAESEKVEAGTYYVKETKASKGFKLDPVVYEVTVTKDKDGSFTSKEVPITGSYVIHKKLEEGTKTNPNPMGYDFTQIKFELRDRLDPSKDVIPISIDENGEGRKDGIYLGDYTLVETATVPNHKLADPINITIDADKVYEYELVNERNVKWLKLQKKDSVSGNMITLSKTSFQIKDAAGNLMELSPLNEFDEPGEKTNTFITDNRGMVEIVDIPVGNYTLIEIKAPQGYKIANPIPVTVTEDGGEATVTMEDAPVWGTVKLLKYDELSGERAGAGFSFRIITDEDIKDGSGATYKGYEKGSIIETITTDENGEAVSQNHLYIGKYHIEEDPTSIPEGYEISDDKPVFEITAENAKETQEPVTVDIDEKALAIYDKPIQIPIRVIKNDAETQKGAGAGFEFQVIADEVKDNTGAVRKGFEKGAVVDTITTGENSIASSKKLPFGTYILKETKAAPGYIIDEAEKTVRVTGSETTKYVRATITNQPILKKVSVTKIDELTGNHAGAGYEFEIKAEEDIKDNAGNIRFAKDDVVETITTNENGVAESNGLYLGKYSLRETKVSQEEGLAINNEVINFELKEDSENPDQIVMDLGSIKDKPTTLKLKKVSSLGGEVIEGVEFSLGAKDEEPKTYTTDKDGYIVVTHLLKNRTYVLRETKAADGFKLPDEEFEFTVDENGLINEKNELVVTATNTPNEVEISKQDITDNSELPGASLFVMNEDGEVIEEWVSTAEPHIIRQIPDGIYVLVEVTAPDGYEVSESVTFEVKDHAIAEPVVMYDAPYREVEISKQDMTGDKELPGCTLTITDEDGKVIDKWVSGEETHKVKLPSGKYTLKEERPAEGYTTAEEIPFEVIRTSAEDYKVLGVQMKNVPTTVTISKKDITNGEEIPGAKLVVKDSEGNVVEEWTSTEEPHQIQQLKEGEYTLTEITAPDGYEVAETITFTVKDTLEVQHVEMFDSPYRDVEISKRSVSGGEEIEGCRLKVTDKDGNVVEEWTSGKEPHYFKVPHGTYTLTETKPADGYVTAESIKFTVEKREKKDDNKVHEVKMFDDVTTVEISKQDVTTEKELPGAKLQIKDADGKIVEEWTSGTEPHVIKMLPTGKYTLTEITAPDGYEKAETVPFEIADTEVVQHVVMYDKPVQKTVTPVPGNPTQPTVTTPRTGDNLNLPLLIGIGVGVIILAGLGVFLIRKGKKKDQEKAGEEESDK